MANYPVKWFNSAMQGAPVLADTLDGQLVAALKAILVTGFGTLTVNSIVWDATENAAKATISAGHAYLKDSIIAVSGATPAGYNGEHRITKISSTEVWFELDGGDPGSSASGTLSMMVAPLGWTMTHESGDAKIAIFRPTDVAASGDVSLRVDNTSWTGWTGTAGNSAIHYLAKVQLVEGVTDINTYTLIYDHRWPATQRYSDKSWDLIGDSQLFYWMPVVGNVSYHVLFCFGYIKSIRPGDRYHAVLVHSHALTITTDTAWNNVSWSSTNNWGTSFATYDAVTQRVIARSHTQITGTATWSIKGMFTRIGTGLAVPNPTDNGLYSTDYPPMVLEGGTNLRGFMPGLIIPFFDLATWSRKNFYNLAAHPDKHIRFIRPLYQTDTGNKDTRTLIGFDLTGPWR